MLSEGQLSLTGDRQAIATALSSARGVRGHEYRPSTPRPGDAWPTLPTLTLVEGLMWQATWSIIVFLPQEERAASEWIDRHFLDIAAALKSPGLAVEAEPAVMQTSGGDQYVLEITMRSE